MPPTTTGNMRAPRALVTGVGSNIGQGVAKALRAAFPDAFIAGTDREALAAGFFALDRGRALPSSEHETYVDRVVEACVEDGIEIVLVGSHGELGPLARARDAIQERSGALVLVSAAARVERCVDKHALVEHLRASGLAHPRSTVDASERGLHELAGEVGFPLVVKPRRGQGSHDVRVVADRDQLARAVAGTRDPIVQEHLGSPDEEHTVAVLCDRHGKAGAVTAMRRTLLAGTTVVAETGRFEGVESEAVRVAESLDLVGPVNVQLRTTERGPVTFEVNPRFSGTTGMRALAGWNDVAAAVRHFLDDEPIHLAPPRAGRVVRYYDEAFLPAAWVARCASGGGFVRADDDEPVEVLRLFDSPHA